MSIVATHPTIVPTDRAPACAVTPLTADQWRSCLGTFTDASFTHLWEFARAAAERVGATHEAVAIRRGDTPIGLAAVRVKQLPFIGGIAYISGGPLTSRSTDPRDARFREVLAALRDHYVRDRGLVLRILGPTGDLAWSHAARVAFVAAGYRPTHASRSYHTILVDTSRPLDQIRASLAQRWRRHLNYAQRQALTIRTGTSDDLVAALGAIYRPMVDRKGFSTDLDIEFYEALAAGLQGDDRFVIHAIESAGVIVSAMLACLLGDTVVAILNATSPQGRELRASYLLHWAALSHAHTSGARWLDLNGIDRDANPGGAQFKEAMGGVEVLAPGPFQAVPTSMSGRLTLAAERGYRAIARLRNRGEQPHTGGHAPAPSPDATDAASSL